MVVGGQQSDEQWLNKAWEQKEANNDKQKSCLELTES